MQNCESCCYPDDNDRDNPSDERRNRCYRNSLSMGIGRYFGDRVCLHDAVDLHTYDRVCAQ